MKTIKRIIVFLFVLIILFSVFALVSGKTYLFKAVVYNFARIDDYRHFTNNTVTAGRAQPWNIGGGYNKSVLPDSVNNLLQDLKSVGLLMVKNDSIVYEQYWDGYTDSSLSGSFSMAKSITSLLIGIAIKEGKIKSVQQPVGDFLPEFTKGENAKLRIIDLLTMSSGSDWDESYINPLSVTAELYYGSDVYKIATGVHIVKQPGSFHAYKSGDSQLLGLLLEKATGSSLSDYAAQKLWQPIGAQHPALWSTDHANGNEKAYCCFNSNTRDFG